MSGKNRTSPEKIGPLVHPDMSGKYQTSPDLVIAQVSVCNRELMNHLQILTSESTSQSKCIILGFRQCPPPSPTLFGRAWSLGLRHSHLQSFATPPPRVAVRRREVIRHADGRGWEKMENVEFRNFPSMTSRKSYCISKIIIFETVSRWLTCDYSPRNNTMSHLLPAVIWWPSSRCICRCLLIGRKLNSIKFLWRYLKSWIKANDT